MSRYIDADALGIGKANRDVFESKAYADGWNAAIDSIESAPTVDVVEVVRCKDCKYWDAVKNPKHKGTGICTPPSESHGGYCIYRGATHYDDFCSRGERGRSKYEVLK